MIRLFGKQENSELNSTDLRIKSVERKLNFVLVIVAAQLVLSVALLVKDTFFPSPITIALIAVLLIGGVWLFRKPLWSMIRRKLLRSMLDDEPSTSGSSTVPGTDDSIR